MSGKLTEKLSCLPSELLQQFQSLPEPPPSASTDPRAALSLHKLLAALDPTLAARWHWRDTRKVLRSLQIIKETGKQASEVLEEQSQIDVQPRYRTLCFWIYADPSILNSRLDARVDDMIQQGLLNEIHTLRDIASSSLPPFTSAEQQPTPTLNTSPDFTHGIYQSIGFREFHQHITCPSPSEQAFNEAVQRMKQSTRQYAKRQISWIRNKLLPTIKAANSREHLVFMYLLDGTDINGWDAQVSYQAQVILKDFLCQKPLPDPLALSRSAREMLTVEERPTSPTSVLNARAKIVCPICTVDQDQPFMVEASKEWEAHQRSRRHIRLAKR